MDQAAFRVRFEYGLEGARAIAAGPGVLAVVVDVLSFSTTVSVAVERGIAVLPIAARDARAVATAEREQAVLASARSLDRPSLSPASLQRASAVERLVLPSPNGATIAAALSDAGATVIAACLRNAGAVARFADRHLEQPGTSLAVIAAGERWTDGSLRWAVEDLWGAGSVLAALATDAERSPEAVAGAAAGATFSIDGLRSCASGRELVVAGFGEDVRIAGEREASTMMPVLQDGWFVAA
ncbi:2-phosphosulfolactate phosphatase [Amnibacterium sp. CER49]|uniref:2-phosphosulfolactate phosphatase n=1 Tax=Amnibacterium sp. CER49 TaxID=3039161 RepID=UPI00244B983F|nr:2-phosphosulfolactate phosphatase [Amnibacterium sp. CER49]MDH2444811.1 2-phosphosulfolactate phosphatase [Amnibacterium sp. CER49]